jgi:hypothetical protein
MHDADPLFLIGHHGASGVDGLPFRLVGGQGFSLLDSID